MALAPTTPLDITVGKKRHDLVDSALVSNPGMRWQGGVDVIDGMVCAVGHVAEATCPPANKSALQPCRAAVEFQPVLLETGFVLDSLSYRNDISGAVEALDRATSSLLEREMANATMPAGAGAQNPDLEAAGTTATTGAALVVLGEILAELGDATASTDGHATILAGQVAAMGILDAIEEHDGLLRTRIGHHRVIVGDFPQKAMYGIHGEPTVFLDPIEEHEFFDRAKNDRQVRVERLALVAFETCGYVKGTVT